MIRRLLINQKNKERIAVIESNKEVRTCDLLKKARGLFPLLPKEQEENIAIFLPNGNEFIAAFWGTIMAGQTAFPLNILMTGHEIFPLLKQAHVKTVITFSAYRNVFEKFADFEKFSLKIIFIDKIKPDTAKYDYETVNFCPDKQMVLLATSGTTGKAKIVRLSEKNIEASVLGYLNKLDFNKTNFNNIRYILAVPFSSAYGLMILSACLLHSFPIIVMDSAFTLNALYMTAEKHKATHYEGSATAILIMEQMSDRAIPYDISDLKYFGFGGSKVSGKTVEKLFETYPDKEFYQGYGMTEASPLIAKHCQGKLKKTDSVGTAIKGMEIAVEIENKIIKTPYVQGEIVVCGPNTMLGYFENKAETDSVLKNGWLYTQDIGYLDEEGYLYICGRKKNMIIVRGFNVYPEEVETCLQNSRLIKDCFVYGQTDAYGNETVCADIILIRSDSEKAVRAYLNEHLAEYKRPQKLSFCNFISKNAFGKTKRY